MIESVGLHLGSILMSVLSSRHLPSSPKTAEVGGVGASIRGVKLTSAQRLCMSGKGFQSRVFRMSLVLLLSSGKFDRLPLLRGLVLEA